MKRLTAILLCLVLLTGCGVPAAQQAPEDQKNLALETEAPATEAPETAAPGTEAPVPQTPAEGSFNLWEENSVDDSMTFQWHWSPDGKELYRYFMEDIFPQYLDTWFEDGEILEDGTWAAIGDGVCGWVTIGGTPKQDMGWNSLQKDGKTVYCRRIQVSHIPHSPDYQLQKTEASPNLHTPDPLVEPDIRYQSIDDIGMELPRINRAELYVKSLGKCFVLQEPEKLAVLQKALDLPPELRDMTFRARLEPEGEGDPLVLDLEGQGQRMVLVDNGGDGGCDIWNGHFLLMPMSIYGLFGVPLTAEAYGKDDEGRMTVTIQREMFGVDTTVIYCYTLDDRGNILKFQDLTPWEETGRKDWMPEGSFSEADRATVFTYDEENRLLSSSTGSGERSMQVEYTYGENGLLAERKTTFGQGTQECYTYEYDEQDRLVARVARTATGEENVGGSVYFWFDDRGEVHYYWFESNGEAAGDPPETPVRRPKK